MMSPQAMLATVANSQADLLLAKDRCESSRRCITASYKALGQQRNQEARSQVALARSRRILANLDSPASLGSSNSTSLSLPEQTDPGLQETKTYYLRALRSGRRYGPYSRADAYQLMQSLKGMYIFSASLV